MQILAWVFLVLEKLAWRFVTDIRDESTNNRAKRELRRIVIHQKTRFFTQSLRSDLLFERGLTIASRCKCLAKSAWVFVCGVVSSD